MEEDGCFGGEAKKTTRMMEAGKSCELFFSDKMDIFLPTGGVRCDCISPRLEVSYPLPNNVPSADALFCTDRFPGV